MTYILFFIFLNGCVPLRNGSCDGKSLNEENVDKSVWGKKDFHIKRERERKKRGKRKHTEA